MKPIKNILGVDLGGTFIKTGFLAEHKPLVLSFKIQSTPKNPQKLIALLIHTILEYHNRYHLQAIGIGCPGPLDIKRGMVINPPYLSLKNFPLKGFLEKKVHLPIVLDNDANAFTLAEAVWGAGLSKYYVIGLTLGTGVGGGIVINKKIYHGRGNGGELGYTLINFKGPRGPFGERGAIQEYTKKLMFTNTKKWGRLLGYTAASLANIFDPDIIIIGGQKAKVWPTFNRELKITFKQNCLFRPPPLITHSKLGDRAGVIGAALLVHQPTTTSFDVW